MRFLGCIVICFVMLTISFPLLAQESNIAKQIEYQFIKIQKNQDPDKAYFNVLKIENKSNKEVSFEQEIIIPKGWKSISFFQKKLTLKPGTSKSVPVRLIVDKKAETNFDFIIRANLIFNKTDTLHASTIINIKAKHNWKFEISNNDVFINPENEQNPVILKINNKGNVPETIYIEMQITDEIKVFDNSEEFQVYLDAGKDTCIKLSIEPKKFYKDKQFSGKTSKIIAFNDFNSFEKAFTVSKLSSTYDYLAEESSKPGNLVGIKTHNLNEPNLLQYSVFTRGEYIFSTSKSLKYDFVLNNLSEGGNFLSSNKLALYYYSNNLKFGIGPSGSALGKNLNISNSIFLDYHYKINKQQFLYFFANQSIIKNEQSLATGHKLLTKNFFLNSSIAVNSDKSKSNNTLSMVSASRLNINKFNTVNFNLKLNRENFYNELNPLKYEYVHTLNYKGTISKKISVGLINEFYFQKESIRINSSLRNVLFAKYNLTGNTSLFAQYNYLNKKNDVNNDFEINENSVKLQLSKPIYKEVRLTAGILYTTYSKNDNFMKSSHSCFFTSNYSKTNIRFNSTWLFGYKNTDFDSLHIKNETQMMFNNSFYHQLNSNNEYFVELKYSNGIYPNENIYLDGYSKLDITASYKQYFYNNHLLLDIGSNYQYSSYNKSQGINIMTGIELNLRRNINIRIDSKFQRAVSGEFSINKLEATFIKGFEYSNQKTGNYDLNITFFKDINSNGKLDADESTIDNVKVNLKYKSSDNKGDTIKKYSMYISLLSDIEGRANYKKIPQGLYEIDFLPLNDLQAWFNFFGNNSTIVLNEDKELLIPFVQAAKIKGSLELQKDRFSSLGLIDVGNIRIKAVDEDGKEYSTLTDHFGSFIIYVPNNKSYIVSINNLFGKKIILKENNIKVNSINKSASVNFILTEKKRKINF